MSYVLERLDLEYVRRILPDVLTGSPFDFIRRIRKSGDKAAFVEALTREIAPDLDLRFVHRTQGSEVGVFAQVLPWDTQFFGYGIARLDGLVALNTTSADAEPRNAALEHLIALARARNVRYLFAGVDSRDTSTLQALGASGFSLIETRLYYHRDLTDFSAEKRFPVRMAGEQDIPLLSEAARDTINPYDRFHADQAISKEDADRLMCEWVRASIAGGFADFTVVPDVESPKAFCTVRYHRSKWDRWELKLAQPVFSAVAPEFRGWYRKLISEISVHLRDAGVAHAYMATQSTNSAVIWTWETLGYRYGRSEHILRRVL